MHAKPDAEQVDALWHGNAKPPMELWCEKPRKGIGSSLRTKLSVVHLADRKPTALVGVKDTFALVEHLSADRVQLRSMD